MHSDADHFVGMFVAVAARTDADRSAYVLNVLPLDPECPTWAGVGVVAASLPHVTNDTCRGNTSRELC